MAKQQLLPLITSLRFLVGYTRYFLPEITHTTDVLEPAATPAMRASVIVACRYLNQILTSTVYDEIVAWNKASAIVYDDLNVTPQIIQELIDSLRQQYHTINRETVRQLAGRINRLYEQ
jgi:hypothetical protein